MKKILSLAVFMTLFAGARGTQPYFFDRNAANQNFQRAAQTDAQPAAEAHEAANWLDFDTYGICDNAAGSNVNEQDAVYMFDGSSYGNLQDAEKAWAAYLTQNLGLTEDVEQFSDSELNVLWYFLTCVEDARQEISKESKNTLPECNQKSKDTLQKCNQENEDELSFILSRLSPGIQDILAVHDVVQGQILNPNIQQIPSIEDVMIDLCHFNEIAYCGRITRMHSDQLATLISDLIENE